VAPVAAPPDLTKATTTDKEHGRLETRTIQASAEVVPHLQWPGAAQVARIERTREIGGKRSLEVATSSPACPPPKPGLSGSWPSRAAIGASRTSCIGFGTYR
jgi:hypothetical protein